MVHVFAGPISGGTLRPQPEEVIEAHFFGPDELPDDLMFGHRQRVLDAFAGTGGSLAWTQHAGWPFLPEMTRQQIYALRDQSGLSRCEFYWQHFRPLQAGEEFDELAAFQPEELPGRPGEWGDRQGRAVAGVVKTQGVETQGVETQDFASLLARETG